jgi:predicted transcriptional regulator
VDNASIFLTCACEVTVPDLEFLVDPLRIDDSVSDPTKQDILGITARIVAAHVANNPVETLALPSLIQSVYRTLSRVGEPEPDAAAMQLPAVSVKKSVFPDFIVCLEDGKKLKMLKRHLQTSYGLTPDDYRAKWGLPRDYPMVAPNYASKRSDLAKQIGLGRKPAAERDEPEAAPSAEPEITVVPARRARGSKG